MRQEYVSPRRYLASGYGIDTSSFAGPRLRAKLAQATNIVNTYCNGALIPTKFDFRGGTVTDEQHAFPIPEPLLLDAGSRRVYPNLRPIRSVTGFSVMFTNNYRIDLTVPDDIFINVPEGYIEVVASQPTIIGFPPVGYWFGLYVPVAEVSYTYGWQFPVTGDVLEADSPLLYYAANGNWLEGGTVNVEVDGSVIDPADYTVNTDDGTVTFVADAEPDADSVVTADYSYVLPQPIADATGIIATDLMGEARMAQRGMLGLQSLRVAEVAMTQMTPREYTARNGVVIPSQAARLLAPFAVGTTG